MDCVDCRSETGSAEGVATWQSKRVTQVWPIIFLRFFHIWITG